MFEITTRFRLTVAAMLLLGARAPSYAQTSTLSDVLLPSSSFAPSGHGLDILINPFSSSPAPGVFFATNPTKRGDMTKVYRITPVDSSSSSYSVESIDTEFDAVWKLGYAPAEGLYGIGEGTVKVKNQSVTGVWKVRLSRQQGNPGTWNDDDSFFYAAKPYSYPSRATGFARDNAGRIFVSGFAYDGRNYRWVVRRKADGSWTTVDNLVNPLAGPYDYSSSSVTMKPALCLFPGNANNPTPAIISTSDLNGKWTVRRSQNGGASWVIVDSWPGGIEQAASADTTCDAEGNIYVVGSRGLNPNNSTGWVVRRSVDGGSTWQIMLDAAPSTSGAAVRLAADANGNVTVSGTFYANGTLGAWKVIRCTNPGDPVSWARSFDAGIYPFGDSTWSRGRGVAADLNGNLFVAGITSGWTDTSISPAITYDLSASLIRLLPAP